MLFGLAIVMDEFSLLFSRLLLLLTLEVVSIGLYFVSIDLVAMEERLQKVCISKVHHCYVYSVLYQ